MEVSDGALAPGKDPPLPNGQEAGWASALVCTRGQRGKILPCLCRSSSQ